MLVFAGSVFAANKTQLIKQAESYYDQREKAGMCEKTQGIYKQIAKSDPKNYVVMWKIARCSYWIGNHAPKKKRVSIFAEGQKYAEAAVRVAPMDPDGHYWLGVMIGRAAEERGIVNSIFVINSIKTEMEKIISLNSKHGGAHYILSQVYFKAPPPPISVGNISKAKEEGLIARRLWPQYTFIHIGLAKIYLALGDIENAKSELQYCIDMTPLASEIPEARDDKDKAEGMLFDLENK